jgi:glycosyltransferase involved in cell wall biosynthesis
MYYDDRMTRQTESSNRTASLRQEQDPRESVSRREPIPVVLVIGQLELGGGAERQVSEIALGIREHGFAPRVISLRAGARQGEFHPENYWADALRLRGISVHELPRRGRLDLSRLMPLIALIREHKPAIVHSFMFPANAYSRVAVLLSGRKPIVVTSERSVRLPKGVKRIVERCLQPLTDGIMVNAHATRRALQARRTPAPVWVIPNGIDIEKFNPSARAECRARLGVAPDDPVIGTVARLVSVKNYPLFIRLVRNVRTVMPPVRAVAIGDGPLRSAVEKDIDRSGQRDGIRLLGRVSRIEEILPALDVFVLTSEYEGLSNAVMEAQASGVPAVVTDVGGNPEIVSEGVTGFVVPRGDLQLLVARVLDLLTRPDLRATMGRAARLGMESRFSVARMIAATVEMYHALLGTRTAEVSGT